jgi:hypothetical protein
VINAPRIDDIRRDAMRYGLANCWTGTSGLLASHIITLLIEREELEAELRIDDLVKCRCEPLSEKASSA